MPTSHSGQINTIVDLVVAIDPKSILDIGIGHGKYGFLSREYLDVASDDVTYQHHKIRIDGIEGFPEYITDLQRLIYDEIFVGNALEVIDTIDRQYDLILMIDVFEHFTKEDGEAILAKCLKKAKHVLISCPKHMHEQGEDHGNKYQEHKFQWRKVHFKQYNSVFIPNFYSLITLIGPDAAEIKKKRGMYNAKLRISAFFPRLRNMYIKLKSQLNRP